MRKVLITTLALILALSAEAAGLTIAPVAATGDCSIQNFRVFSGLSYSGGVAKYCFAVDDTDTESEPGLVLGPLAAGNYMDDWANGGSNPDWASGISSFKVSAGNYRVCIYWAKGFRDLWGSLPPGFGANAPVIFNDHMGSFKWVHKSSNCPNG